MPDTAYICDKGRQQELYCALIGLVFVSTVSPLSSALEGKKLETIYRKITESCSAKERKKPKETQKIKKSRRPLKLAEPVPS